ncbi:MAG: GNAT family N-acetyltransferase [Planctomycetes bacterium]|nr:GNAT family N-acetyltransferase [Planctomycetota bacterium]
MKYRIATDDDLDLLAEWNYQLIRDEGHRNPMNVMQLKERMRAYIADTYEAIIFSNNDDFAYALYQKTEEEVYLRQFYVTERRRRQGLGKAAMRILFTDVWPPKKTKTVAVLTQNAAAMAFWRSLGYQDYCLKLEMPGNSQ